MDRRFSRVAAAIDSTVKSCGFSKTRSNGNVTWVRTHMSGKHGHHHDEHHGHQHQDTHFRFPTADEDARGQPWAVHHARSLSPESMGTEREVDAKPRNFVERVEMSLDHYRYNMLAWKKLEESVSLAKLSKPRSERELERLAENLSPPPRNVMMGQRLNKLHVMRDRGRAVAERAKDINQRRQQERADRHPDLVTQRRVERREAEALKLAMAKQWATVYCLLQSVAMVREVVVKIRGFKPISLRFVVGVVRLQRYLRKRRHDRVCNLLRGRMHLFQACAQRFRQAYRERKMDLIVDFLREAKSCSSFRVTVIKYATAVRVAQRSVVQYLRVIRSQQEALSRLWTRVDNDRVLVAARMRHNEAIKKSEEVDALMRASNAGGSAPQREPIASRRKDPKSAKGVLGSAILSVPPLKFFIDSVQTVPIDLKRRSIAEDLRNRRRGFFSLRREYYRKVATGAAERSKAIEKEVLMQQIAFQGDLADFRFQIPAHLVLPPPPKFRVLITPLQMRLLVRIALEETKRLQLAMNWLEQPKPTPLAGPASVASGAESFGSSGVDVADLLQRKGTRPRTVPMLADLPRELPAEAMVPLESP